ncbi:MAG TPA: S41 family peptidase [Acidobacteriota bacterium]|nr:S41 family peptidase [Acidobacteriota bacterium]
MRLHLLTLTALLVWSGTLLADEARLLRFPDVTGDKVTFVYAGDIYVVSRGGGQAIQLTTHEGLELFPKFSPDGSAIAFTGQYDGDWSVYVMPVIGGEPVRLTYHPGIQQTSERFGPENVVMGWHPDGSRVLFRSRRETNDWWDGRAYLVSVTGGLPEPLPMAVAGFTSFSPGTDKVAYCPIHRDFRTWKRYKGGMAQDVWIFDLNSFEAEKITDWAGTDNMPMWHGDKIYFNSDRTGTLNLYSYDVPTGELRQVTSFTEYDVRWPSLGPDGIAFENGGYVYVLDLPSEAQHKLNISLTTDRHAVRPEFAGVSDRVIDYDISPDGKRAAMRARGDLFTVPAKEGDVRNLTASPGANEAYPRWSPDGKWIAYFSDATGEDELYLTSHDGAETVQLTTGGDCHRFDPVWSPDSRRLAFSDKNLKLHCVDIETKKVIEIDRAKYNSIRDAAWSPDSRYVCYSKDVDSRISAVFMYAFDDNTVHQVTPALTNDYSPVFDPDGKYLYFLSERNFNPILSSYEFSMVYNAIDNLFLIVLDADTPSPFAPRSDEVTPTEEKSVEKESEKAKPDKESGVKVKVDFNGIFDRQVAFDLPAGNYSGLAAVPGAVFYVSNPIRGLRGNVTQDERILHKYDLNERKRHEFLSGIGGYRLSADQQKAFIEKDSSFYIVSIEGSEADLKDKALDLSGMETRIDRPAEYVQMFNQVWRAQRDYFYDRNMHGVDWAKMRDRYAVLLPYVSNRFDLTYIIGEMVGELCCSHTYVGGGDYPSIPPSEIGLLGADLEIDHASDRIRIKRILVGENWDEQLRSPLREPGIDVKEGEYLLAINGEEITAATNPYALTENTVGKQITLTVNDRPTMSGAREVTIKPLASEETLRYFNWVEKRRRYVDSLSDGQIGYIHIPDMDDFGLVRFSKMFYNQVRRPGLIVDVRYNGGGFVSSLILDRLRRPVTAMGMSRNTVERPVSGTGLNAHMATLTNEFSCSDGDYFAYFFRHYGLGPLIGTRTWGGVVGIEGFDPLVDGGYYTVPGGTIYTLDGKWVMENIGVEPDMKVENRPDRLARDYDDQLDRAIEYVKAKLKEDPKTLPPLPDPPTPR